MFRSNVYANCRVSKISRNPTLNLNNDAISFKGVNLEYIRNLTEIARNNRATVFGRLTSPGQLVVEIDQNIGQFLNFLRNNSQYRYISNDISNLKIQNLQPIDNPRYQR